MTWRAIAIEQERDMIRICRLCILHLVALITIVVGEIVIVIRVARNARCCDMSARERERGVTVIKRCRAPRPCRVAIGTVLTKAPGNVIRIRGPVEISLMTANTGARCPLVHIIHMAITACRCLMGTRQRKVRIGVTECRWPPHGGVMTRQAIISETRQHMPRTLRLVVLRLMAGIAVRVL
jgi:hypothetical protein